MDEMDEMGWYDEAVMVLWVMYAKMYAMMMGMSMNWGLRLPSLYTLQSMNIDMATNIGKKQLIQISSFSQTRIWFGHLRQTSAAICIHQNRLQTNCQSHNIIPWLSMTNNKPLFGWWKKIVIIPIISLKTGAFPQEKHRQGFYQHPCRWWRMSEAWQPSKVPVPKRPLKSIWKDGAHDTPEQWLQD